MSPAKKCSSKSKSSPTSAVERVGLIEGWKDWGGKRGEDGNWQSGGDIATLKLGGGERGNILVEEEW